jgi:hypothetical protein
MLYKPLQEEKIRLLQVDLTNHGDRYQLLDNISPTAPGLHYTAVSYTWGSIQGKQRIMINNSSVLVSPNLFKALADIGKHYRKQGHAGVLLWIDQICINQDDDDEKSIQVKSMSDIYRNAETVLVWLSVPAGSLHQGYNSSGEAWIPWASSSISDTSRGLSLGIGSLGRDFDDETWHSAWTGVLAIVRNPWWERAWIYQEFMLAKDVFFLVDGHALPWRQLQTLLNSCASILQIYEAEEKYYKSMNDWVMPQYLYPKTHYFRCPRCMQVKGGQWMMGFVKNPANWLFLLICYIFIRMLPREMAGHAGYASFFQRTISRTDQSNWYKIISSCDCNINDYRDSNLLRLPPFKTWEKSEYGKRWLLSICRDRSFWSETFYQTFTFSFLLPFLHFYVWSRVPGPSGNVRPHWVLLNTILHGVLIKLPTSDFNDGAQDIAFQHPPTYLSWSGIRQSTLPYWTLSTSLLAQRSAGIETLPLSTVIHRARDTRSSDPRDKVFAFLNALHLTSIVPDYSDSNKVSTVLTAASEAIITQERSFDQVILAMEDNASSLDSLHLPSWVPNWSRPRIVDSEFGNARKKGLGGEFRHVWRASGNENASVSFHTDRKGRRILRAQAIYVETLGKSQFWITPNGYKGKDTGVDITTLATLSNSPRREDEVWLLLGANMPFVLRDCALEDAIGEVPGSVLASLLPGFLRAAVKRWVCGDVATRKTYRVVCEAAVWDGEMKVNTGGLIEELRTGKIRAREVDIC